MITGSFCKTKQGITVEYRCCRGEEKIAAANIPSNAPKKMLQYRDSLYGNYELSYLPAREMKQLSSDFDKGNLAYEIKKQGERVGYLCTKKQGGWFNSYLYDEIFLEGAYYHAYFIALGEQGKKITFYKKDLNAETQVGEVSKSNVVIDRLDEYYYQVTEEDYILPLGIYLLYFDFRKNMRNYGEKAVGTREVLVSTTKDKGLLDKYNPNFGKSGM